MAYREQKKSITHALNETGSGLISSFTAHGVPLALAASIRLPGSNTPSKRDTKDQMSLTSLNDETDKLLSELNDATDTYETIAGIRDRHNDAADLGKAARLNREFLDANSRLSRAECNYYDRMSHISEQQTSLQTSSSEAEQGFERKQQDNPDQENENEEHESLCAEIQALKHQARKHYELIEKVKRESQIRELESIRKILALEEENTELSGFNMKLAWEGTRLTAAMREAESSKGYLVHQIQMLKSAR